MSEEKKLPSEPVAAQVKTPVIQKIKVPVAPAAVKSPAPRPTASAAPRPAAAAPAATPAPHPTTSAAAPAPAEPAVTSAPAEEASPEKAQEPVTPSADSAPSAAETLPAAKKEEATKKEEAARKEEVLPASADKGRRLRRGSATIKPKRKLSVSQSRVFIKLKKVLRSKLFILSAILLVLCGAVVGAISSLPYVVESKLPAFMARQGIVLKSFKVKKLGISQSEFVNFVLSSGAVRARSVKITYFLPDLWNKKQIKSMEINGLTVNGEVSEDSLSLGGLEKVILSRSQENQFYVNNLRILNGQLVISKQDSEEPFVLNYTSTGSVQKDSLMLKTDMTFLNDKFSVKGLLALVRSKAMTTLNAEISEGNVLNGEKVIGGVTGTWSLNVQDGALTEAKANLALETSEQAMKIAGTVVPKGESFAFDGEFSRNFKEGVDSGDNFIGDVSLKSDNITFKGNSQNATVDLPLDLKVVSAKNKIVTLNNLNLSADGVLECVDAVCTYSLKQEALVSLDSAQYRGMFNQIKIAEPVKFSMMPAKKIVTFQKGNLTLAGELTPFSVKVFSVTSSSSSQIAAALKNNSQLDMAYNMFAGTYGGKLSFDGAELLTKDFKTQHLTGVVTFNQTSLLEAKFLAKDIQLTQTDVVAPFDLQVTLAPLNAEEYSMDMFATMKSGLLTLKAKGSYSFASKTWSLFLDAPKTAFSPTGVSFEEAFPFYAKKLNAPLTGTLAVNGRLTIAGKRVTGMLKVLLMDVSTTVGTFDLKNLTTVLHITSFAPFETLENQNVFVGQMNMGIPFKDAVIVFRAAADGITVSSVNMQYADASFRLMKPLFVPYDGAAAPFLIEGLGINFSQLSGLLRIPGLEVDGTGDLLLKLSLDKDAVMIEDGRLTLSKAAGGVGGMFRFDPPSSQKVSLDPRMKEFLKSVVFKNMILTMTGKPVGKMSFKFMLEGYASSDETQRVRKVSLNIDNSLQKLLKTDGAPSELPLGIMRMIQENFK